MEGPAKSVPRIRALLSDSLRSARRLVPWRDEGDTILVIHGGKASSFAFLGDGTFGLTGEMEGHNAGDVPAVAAFYPYSGGLTAGMESGSLILGGITLPSRQEHPHGIRPLFALDTSSRTSLPETLTFDEVLGTVRIPVTGSATLRKAELLSLDSLPLWGEFEMEVGIGEDIPATLRALPEGNGDDSPLTLDFGEEGLRLGRDTTYLEFAVPPGTYKGGFHLRLIEDSRRWMDIREEQSFVIIAGTEGTTLGPVHYFPSHTPSRTLVVSFSPEGKVGDISRRIASMTGADLFEILPTDPYLPRDYKAGDTSSRSYREQEGTVPTPTFLGGSVPLEGYDKIFVGYPVWWDSVPRILYPVIGDPAMAGRTLIPFYTGGSSALTQQGTARYLGSLCQLSPVTGTKHFDKVPSEGELSSWLSSLGMHFGGDDFVYMETGGGEVCAVRLCEGGLADAFRNALPLSLTLGHEGGGDFLWGDTGTDLDGDASVPRSLHPGDVLLSDDGRMGVFLGKETPNPSALRRVGRMDGTAIQSLSPAAGGEVKISLTGKPPLRVVKANEQVSFPALPRGNYSAAAWVGGDRYILVDDKSASEGWREVSLSFDAEGRITDIRPLRVISNPGSSGTDNEAVAFVPSRGTVFLGREKGNAIVEFTTEGKPTGNVLPTPMFPSNGNAGLESLAYNPITRTFYSTTEGTLPSHDTHRIQAWGEDLREKGFWLYRMDKAQAPSPHGGTYAFGISELCALDDGRLLVMEREADVYTSLLTMLNSRTIIKLYVVDPDGCPRGGVLPKTLVATWSTLLPSLANYEGMCLGPRRADGKRILILLCDGQATLPDYFRTLVLD